jgi:mannose-1-phosphate guanylyltransferase
MWSLKSISQAFEQFLPEVNDLFKRAESSYNTPSEQDIINQVYQVCRNISVDYGIMEHATNVYVYAADFGWSDLGTWGSLYDIRKKNSEGNAITGRKVKTYNTKNCIINMPKDKVVVLQGLEDYIVVENDDILLICSKKEEQQIRQFSTDVQIDFGDKYV